MGQQGELVGNTQGGCKGQAWSHSGTSIGDHWGRAGGLVGCVKGVGSMHETLKKVQRGRWDTGEMWGHSACGGTEDPWACGGAHGSMAGRAGKHGKTGVGGQQDTHGGVVRDGGTWESMWKHGGDEGVRGPGMA